MGSTGSRSLTPILFLADAFPPKNVIGALRPFRFAKYLPQFGYQAHVLTESPQPDPRPDVQFVPASRGRLQTLVNLALFRQDERVSWARPAVRAAGHFLDAVPARVVFSTSPPIGGHLAALWLKRQRDLKWVADFRDPLKGNFGRGRHFPGSLIDPFLERLFFDHADALIANTEAAAAFWSRRSPRHRSKIHVIYNGFDPETPQLQAAPIPLRPHRVLLHAGSLYTPFAKPWRLLDAFARLLNKGLIRPEAMRLRLVGEIVDEPSLRRFPSFRVLERAGSLECTPVHIPVDEARRAMSQSDYFLVLDRDSPHGVLQLPAKLFEYIQIGRPILAWTSPGAPVEQVLALSGIPHVCLYMNDPDEDLDRKILLFLELPNTPAEPSGEYRRQFGAVYQAGQLARICDLVQTV